MGMYIFIGLTLFFLALLLMSEYIGRNFWRFAPKEHLKQGEKIHVYVNGKYDRHATIDQGPIIVMIENYRTGLIWKLFIRYKFHNSFI